MHSGLAAPAHRVGFEAIESPSIRGEKCYFGYLLNRSLLGLASAEPLRSLNASVLPAVARN